LDSTNNNIDKMKCDSQVNLAEDHDIAVSDAPVPCLLDQYSEFQPDQLSVEVKSEMEFKMPENFDIPPEYIKQIVPKKNIQVKLEESFASLGVPLNPMSSTPLNTANLTYTKDEPDSHCRKDLEKTITTPTMGSVAEKVSKNLTGNNLIATSTTTTTTYYSKETSSKSSKSNKRHMSGDAKRNRKRQSYVAELFGECSQESEGNVPDTPKVRKEFETCGGTATILSGEKEAKPGASADVSTPDPELLGVLQDKKERIKKRLMDTDSENGEKAHKEKKKKRKKMRSKSNSSPGHSKSSAPQSTVSSTKSSISQSSDSQSKSSHTIQTNNSGFSTTKHNTSVSVKIGEKRKPSGKPKEARSKAPFKFEDDDKWLVRDSYEDSPPSEGERRKREKKKKKKKKQDRKQEDEDSSEDERRKRLDERKQKSGGDALSWMFRRAKVSVKYQEHGKECIVDKAIYKMNLIGDEDEESSGVEQELKQRKREEETNSESEILKSRSSSPHKKKKKRKKSKKNKKTDRHSHNQSSDEERDRIKIKRSFSWQETEHKEKVRLPIFQKSISTFGTNSFKIPKLSKPNTEPH